MHQAAWRRHLEARGPLKKDGSLKAPEQALIILMLAHFQPGLIQVASNFVANMSQNLGCMPLCDVRNAHGDQVPNSVVFCFVKFFLSSFFQNS